MATLIESIGSQLDANAGLVARLPGGIESIRRGGSVTPDDTYPLVVVRAAPTMGSVRRRPEVEVLVEIRVYDRSPNRNNADFALIDHLLTYIRDNVLDGNANIEASSENMFVWLFAWDGVRSPDLYDPIGEAWYHWDRYRAYAMLKTHYHA